MKKILLTILALMLFCFMSFSQSESEEVRLLKVRIERLEQENSKLVGLSNKLKTNLRNIEKKQSASTESIISLKSEVRSRDKQLVSSIQKTSDKASTEITNLNKTLSKSTFYWIIAVIAIAFLSIVLFSWLRKQLIKEKTNLIDKIKKTSNTLHEEQLKLDEQLIKLLEKQMNLVNKKTASIPTKSDEIDHTLALKVADEVIRIQKNLSIMDSDAKGLRQLTASVKRIQENFKANGYELVEMLNKPYDPGMKVIANFKPDENLKQEEQIITRIIKPQVNYKNVMIQAAQIEVSQGE